MMRSRLSVLTMLAVMSIANSPALTVVQHGARDYSPPEPAGNPAKDQERIRAAESKRQRKAAKRLLNLQKGK